MAPDECSHCDVRGAALCSTFSDADRAALDAISRHKTYEKGSTVMWAGDEAVVCGTIISGILKLSASASDGRTQIFGLLYPADFVGQPHSGQMPFSVTTLTDCHLCLYPRAAFEDVLENNIALERLLLRRTMAALDEARSRMLLLSRGTSEEKLACFLIEMADRAVVVTKAGEALTIELPVSRGQIADLLGLTVETVSRQMTHFKTNGLIDLPGGRLLTILNPRGLKARALLD